jgi:adenine-specific DNA-methyltransferase
MSKITSIKHKEAKRAHIPSKEEAGMETANEHVNEDAAKYPLNPVIHRGQDPELFWRNKYYNNDPEQLLKVDIRSLYRHEHISPELLIKNLYKIKEGQSDQLDMFSLFGNTLKMDELEKVADYYKYSDDWKNRLIQGDSLLVMTSLLEREGMAGKVQTIYFDPPYGIKYGSNWQIKLNSLDVKDGNDDNLSGEPEMIKAFRDTWEFGIHSYLSYLRDRLLVTKELLTETGSCFVQISEENIHLVRNVLDEIFGSENFVSQINFATSSGFTTKTLSRVGDYLLWYAKDISKIKYRQLYTEVNAPVNDPNFKFIELKDGLRRQMTSEERQNPYLIPYEARIFRLGDATSQGKASEDEPFEFEGHIYRPGNRHWTYTVKGMRRLADKNLVVKNGNNLSLIRYFDNYILKQLTNIWSDTATGGFNEEKEYVVQTNTKTVERCILMTSDPGDLVLDPTCGSGTSAYMAEQLGRRWITIDTSRIAINIAKSRLMMATYPYYELHDQQGKDIRQGFIYKSIAYTTLKNLANDELPEEETLFDQPKEDKKKLRVSGPFTVETLQNFEPVSPDGIDSNHAGDESIENFEERIFEHLKSAGVKNGIKNENAVFKRVERKASAYLNAEGFYNDGAGAERKAYIHIGPKFGTVSKQAVNEAVKECRNAGDGDWLIILGFSFEADISNQSITMNAGSFEVTKVRMHDDLMQEGLLKKDKKAASFVTIGEPDIELSIMTVEGAAGGIAGDYATVSIQGLDIYDPIKDEVKARSVADIAYWMVDDDYDSSNFIVKQIFFCGGDKDEFDKWKKGLSNLAKETTKTKAQNTLKIELDDDAWDRLYGFQSHPIQFKKGKKIAVRVISQFGEESMKVINL